MNSDIYDVSSFTVKVLQECNACLYSLLQHINFSSRVWKNAF